MSKIAIADSASRIGFAAMTVTAAAILTATPLRAEPFDQTSPEALIKALEGVYGPHPGFRKNHAKGTCATGSFVGLPETTSYTRSALFSGATVPVVARFSLGGGDPDAPDAGKGPRGMGLEFRLADGGKQHRFHFQPREIFGDIARDPADAGTDAPLILRLPADVLRRICLYVDTSRANHEDVTHRLPSSHTCRT